MDGVTNRDVFYDGNEKLVTRTDARHPEEAPKKYKVRDSELVAS